MVPLLCVPFISKFMHGRHLRIVPSDGHPRRRTLGDAPQLHRRRRLPARQPVRRPLLLRRALQAGATRADLRRRQGPQAGRANEPGERIS